MNRAFEATILVWCPESTEGKSVLLNVRAQPSARALAEVLLENGPVVINEPGFAWSSDPAFSGLCVWSGMVEMGEDGDFHFAGEWRGPTVKDLRDLSGLDSQLKSV